MTEETEKRKKRKTIPSPLEVKQFIQSSQEPMVLKNILTWDILKWSLNDWVNNLDNPVLDFRLGTKQCTKVPQWENSCESISVPLRDVLEKKADDGTWMYFDYKHMKHYFKNNPEFLESLSWADFGFPEKNGKDSTIWIGTEGAYTPCHMDSYGRNIVAQICGRKLWILFPPNRTSSMKPTRVPYEESSIYSNIHFSCGRNICDVGEARAIELHPGDVLIVPKHWWHYVENLTTAVSINMWLPLECDDASRLEEALIRFNIATTLKGLGIDECTSLLNPNEVDLLDETIDLRQITWCVEQVLKRDTKEEVTSQEGGDHREKEAKAEGTNGPSVSSGDQLSCLSAVPKVSFPELQQLLLKKCGCDKTPDDPSNDCSKPKPLTTEHIINAFCHPTVIAQVAEVLVSMMKE